MGHGATSDEGSMYNGPTFANKWSPNEKAFVDIFIHFLPHIFLEETTVNATSNTLLEVNVVSIMFGEMLQYIGMMLLMSCYTKLPDYFWRMATRMGDELEDKKNNIPWFIFNQNMTWWHYLAITSALQFTLCPQPTFWDEF